MRAVSDADFFARLAMEEIRENYGVGAVFRERSVQKFGRTENADNGVATTVAIFPGTTVNETYVSTNTIDSISSDDDGDDQTLTVAGHTISGSGADAKFTYLSQTVTLNGQTRVALSTPLARVERVKKGPGVTSFSGTVYIYENTAITAGVPDDTTKAHICATAAAQQSEKAAITIADEDFGVLTGWYCGTDRAAASVNVDAVLQVMDPGGSFRVQHQMPLRSDSQGFIHYPFRPYLVVTRNSDIRVQATATANDTNIVAGFSAMYAMNEALA
jgi:hypothetical protein